MSYQELRNELENLRASREDQASHVKTNLDIGGLQGDAEKPPHLTAHQDLLPGTPWWWRLFSQSWRVQLAFTLLLWATLLNVGFGAIFFVSACLYWLYAWGTTTEHRMPRRNTIFAGWYYDNSRVF